MTPDERMNDRVALSMIGLVSSGVVLAVGFLFRVLIPGQN